MSQKHPVIAVTGSSGAGTSTVKNSFEHIFHGEKLNAVVVEGDSFHRYDREAMKLAVADSEKGGGRPISHFGPEANEFEKLEALFKQYGENGTGSTRLYLHNDEEAEPWDQKPGTFTPWTPVVEGSDLLFYEGLHGGVKSDTADVARYVDLLVGVVPIVNLEWIQKIHRDTNARGYSPEAVTHTILRRMHDYVHYITPQFSRTHINFQRVPTVDTSNPFIARDIPTLDESLVVIRFSNAEQADFPNLLATIHDSFMSRPNTIVVPGGKMGMAIELILTPLILEMMTKSKG
ncbi:phosphoribulokinase [Nitrosomonas cryotolerans]|uniref:Phosphoribulokinase n=1 Tax=Nitrosomonas cryotolerans ATCC 49181 TaxID=1131553 RepID=A0A1N6I0N8_9PROT|nr:phosphoribulokinase [Nitrosomonas cryotolerans]SFP58262.1 phosphoribulokinase [Nitrosomonas cryotolerans]SIO25618.1 phosphoribulokinase [Nitrosomonas cryotolerans ATCC 49181]